MHVPAWGHLHPGHRVLGDGVGDLPGVVFVLCPPGPVTGIFAGNAGSVPRGVGTAGQEALGRVSFLQEPPRTESSCAMLCCPPPTPSSRATGAAMGSPPSPAIPHGLRTGPFFLGRPVLGLLLGLASASAKSQAARRVKLGKFCT